MKASKLLMTLAAFVLVSCGGGGGSSVAPLQSGTPPVQQPTNGIDRGGVAIGVITGFGSIFVNGIRFDTSATIFTIDDNPGSQSDLDVGKVVTVVGTIDADNVNGTADEVIYNDDVQGPIQSIDFAASTMVVLGQTVIVNADTVFDDSIFPSSLDGLSVGQIVEISGFVGADGSITATHIEPAGNTDFDIAGIVSALDPVAMTFRINSQAIDYSGATLRDFPAGQIEDGMRVEAEGSSFGPDGELIATKVDFEGDDWPGDENDDFEIEGLITRYVSATDFDVSGYTVTTTVSTIFENGSATDLAEGVKVEVEGSFDSEGTLVARKVSVRRTARIELRAHVEATDNTAGTITLLGLTIGTDDVTRFEDNSDLDVPIFGLDDIAVGDWVEVRAFTTPSGDLVATHIERDDAEDEIEIKAPVDSVARPDLQVLGLTIQTDANTDFEDGNDTTLTADDFFARVSDLPVVKITGVLLGGNVIRASKIELQQDNEEEQRDD